MFTDNEQLEQVKTRKSCRKTETGGPRSKRDEEVNRKHLDEHFPEQFLHQGEATRTFTGILEKQLFNYPETSGSKHLLATLFIGPPDSGKTRMAETTAVSLDYPFRHFNMKDYSDKLAEARLVGASPLTENAAPGTLTGFAANNPDAVILISSIEYAHPSVYPILSEILRTSSLEDRFTGNVSDFSGTIIIMTTAAGESFYGNPGKFGICPNGSQLWKRSLLETLRNVNNPDTGERAFPPTFIKELARVQPVIFTKPGITQLEKLASSALSRTVSRVQQQHNLELVYPSFLPTLLAYRYNTEINPNEVPDLVERLTGKITDCLAEKEDKSPEELSPPADETKNYTDNTDLGISSFPEEIQALFKPTGTYTVLLAADRDTASGIVNSSSRIEWLTAQTTGEILDILSSRDIDLILVDRKLVSTCSLGMHLPILQTVRSETPDIPVYILIEPDLTEEEMTDLESECLCLGGARGTLPHKLSRRLPGILETLYRERQARMLERQNLELVFETSVTVNTVTRQAIAGIRNLRLRRLPDFSNMVEFPSIHFTDLIGRKQEIEKLHPIVMHLKNQRIIAGPRTSPVKTVLLMGPRGTGRTTLARAVAGEASRAFLTFPDSILTPDTFREHQEFFLRVARYAPAVICLELTEIPDDASLKAFISQLEKIASFPEKTIALFMTSVIAHGASRTPESWFDLKIEVEKPDREERLQYITRSLAQRGASLVAEETVRKAAEKLVGFNFPDIEHVISRAAAGSGLVFDRAFESSLMDFITEKPGKLMEESTLLRIARHKAGHALVSWACSFPPGDLTLLGLGRMESDKGIRAVKEGATLTRVDLQKHIRIRVAGRAAEIACYGKEEGMSTAAAGDLEEASRIAAAMVLRYGMSEEFGLFDPGAALMEIDSVSAGVIKAVNSIIREQLDNAVRIIQDNREHLDAIAAKLIKQNRVPGRELEELLPPVFDSQDSLFTWNSTYTTDDDLYN